MRAARAGAECASISPKPRVDFADAMRIVGRLGLGGQRRQLGMRGQHRFEQRLRAARRFLRNMR